VKKVHRDSGNHKFWGHEYFDIAKPEIPTGVIAVVI
jgi:hypothetical protein